MRGTVKKLVIDKGFGFIQGEDGIERFFHRSAVHGTFETLREREAVSFEEEPSAKGPRATNVRTTR